MNHIILNTSPDPVPKAVSPPKFKALLQNALKKATHRMHVANKALHKATAKLHQKAKTKTKAKSKVTHKAKAKVTMKKTAKAATAIRKKMAPKPTKAHAGSSGNSGVFKRAPTLKESEMHKISILSPKHHDMALSQSEQPAVGGKKLRRVPRVKA